MSKPWYSVSRVALGRWTAHHDTGDYKVFDTREEAERWASIEGAKKLAARDAKKRLRYAGHFPARGKPSP